jgi:MFS family permease
MSTVALAVMVYKMTGSVLQMGGIMAASTIPLVLTAWVGGALLDRYSARNLLVAADVARAVLIFAMPLAAQQAIALAYLLAAFMGIFSGIFNPGQVKLVGELVDREHLVKVNSYLGVSRDAAELIGYLIGGAVAAISGLTILGVGVTGYVLAFVVDALSYGVSAVLLVGLPRGSQDSFQRETRPSLHHLVLETPTVFGRLCRQPGLRTNLLLAVFAAGAITMFTPNSYALALQVFDRGSLGLAALEVFVAAGLIAGGLIVSRMRLKGDKNRYVFSSVLVVSTCLVAVSFSPLFWLSVCLLGIGGMANVGMVVPSITMFQQIPATRDKGRLISLRTGFGQLGVAAGFLLGGLVGAELGVKQAFLLSGVSAAVISLIIYLPYRLGASRRAKTAWNAAMEAGATRSTARQMAREAALNGVVTGSGPAAPGVAAWAAATEMAVDNTGGDA